MTRQEIFNTVVDIVHECAPETENQELTEDTVINTDVALDSMGFTMIICRLEAVLGVKIPDRRWQKLFTVGDVVDEFQKRMK